MTAFLLSALAGTLPDKTDPPRPPVERPIRLPPKP
jgi:hypothetical protein